MHYVIATGGKQFIVKQGDTITIEKIDAPIGESVDFEIISVIDGDSVITESKELSTKKVTGKILDQKRDTKIRVFKYKRRKRYRRNYGHRQYITSVEIVECK